MRVWVIKSVLLMSLFCCQAQAFGVQTAASTEAIIVRTVRVTAPPKTYNQGIGSVFFDRNGNRLLAEIRTGKRRLVWVKGQKVRLLSPWPQFAGSDMAQLLAADFAKQWLYFATPTATGPGGYTTIMPFASASPYDAATMDNGDDGLFALAVGKKDRTYRAFNERYKDIAEGGWFGIFDEGD